MVEKNLISNLRDLGSLCKLLPIISCGTWKNQGPSLSLNLFITGTQAIVSALRMLSVYFSCIDLLKSLC